MRTLYSFLLDLRSTDFVIEWFKLGNIAKIRPR